MLTGDRAGWLQDANAAPVAAAPGGSVYWDAIQKVLKIGGEKISTSQLEEVGQWMTPNGELVQFVFHLNEAGGDCITAYAPSFRDLQLSSERAQYSQRS